MEQHTEQHFDNLAKKVLKNASLEKTSIDFTANIMTTIEAESKKHFTYKPLISKIGWFTIIVILSGVSIYMMISNNENSIVFNNLDFSLVSNNGLIEAISGIKFSKTLALAVGFFGIAWLVQLSLLKNYFNKRLQY